MAHVQSVSKNSYSATVTHTQAISGVVAGNCLIVATRVANGASYETVSVSSSADGAFTAIENVSNGAYRAQSYILENATAGSHTITITSPTINNTVRLIVAEYDDVPSAGVVDDSASGSFTTTTTPSTASVTTSGDDRTVLSFVSPDNDCTTIEPAGGETERQQVNVRFQLQDEAAASAGSHSASWTLGTTQPGTYTIIALKPATVAGPVPPPILTHTIRNVLLRM